MNHEGYWSHAMFLGLGILWLPPLQQVTTVDALFQWWFSGLGGLGGWALFFLVAVGANAYIFLDSTSRHTTALGWKAAGLLPIILILPTVLFRFASPETQTSLLNMLEGFFFMGLVGGIVPLAAAVGYAISFAGYVAETAPSPLPPLPPPPVPPRAREEQESRPAAPKPVRQHINAWLIDVESRHSYQLFEGDTRIGRSRQNDIVLNDQAVSREHALIREERGHVTLYDRGARTGIRLNGHRVEGPQLLSHGDTIELGDTQLQFVTSQ